MRVSGTVKWFNASKGFGFFVWDGKDVFVHKNALTKSNFNGIPKDGASVEFEIDERPDGRLRAMNIK